MCFLHSKQFLSNVLLVVLLGFVSVRIHRFARLYIYLMVCSDETDSMLQSDKFHENKSHVVVLNDAITIKKNIIIIEAQIK